MTAGQKVLMFKHEDEASGQPIGPVTECVLFERRQGGGPRIPLVPRRGRGPRLGRRCRSGLRTRSS